MNTLFRDNNAKEIFEQGPHRTPHAHLAELKAWLLAKWGRGLIHRPACRAVWIDKIEIGVAQVTKAVPRFYDEAVAR